MASANEPRTLQEAVIYFADLKNCVAYMVARRWPDGVICPTCGSSKVKYQEKHARWQCSAKHPKRQFTAKVGTIFEDSPIGLDKWLTAVWMITNCKNGVSSWEMHRTLGVTQKTAWFMLHRIRLAMQSGAFKKLSGAVEADETFVGGKVANMHLDKQTRARMGKKRIGGYEGKTAVMGLLERHGEARVKVIPNTRKHSVRAHIFENVKRGSTIYSDALKSYQHLEDYGFEHEFIDHAEAYVRDNVVHTNGLENFWSLLKRALKGTYVSVEPFHLQAYADEQCFRFNNRKDMDDADRFDAVMQQIVGKRLTYAELTGKDDPSATQAIN
ncbi:MAG TPA: IS1595 family transposase [Bryobacteraceae bacterium]|nr:IS1595 family transposase [Bryobacteraceae bacterium]